MLSELARKCMQAVLNQFDYIQCDTCDWKAYTVDDTMNLLHLMEGNKKLTVCSNCYKERTNA